MIRYWEERKNTICGIGNYILKDASSSENS